MTVLDLLKVISVFAPIPSFMDSEHWKPAYSQISQIILGELVEGAGSRAGLELHNLN